MTIRNQTHKVHDEAGYGEKKAESTVNVKI